MENYVAYKKFATLSNGKRLIVRLLNGQDRDRLIKFFQQTPREDVRFCKQNVKNPKFVDNLLNPENSPSTIS